MYRPPRSAEDMADYNSLQVPTPGPNEDLSKQVVVVVVVGGGGRGGVVLVVSHRNVCVQQYPG